MTRRSDDPFEADPKTLGWTLVPASPSAPSPRVLATALEVGGVVMVFGGGDAAGTADYKDGALFEPASASWTPIPAAPKERRAPVMAAVGMTVLVWGGWDKAGQPVPETHSFDLPSKSWSVVTSGVPPSARTEFAWAASADRLYVHGGRIAGTTKTDEAHRAELTTGAWSAIGKGPSGRWGSFGAWDGVGFWVWGGDDNNAKADGKRYYGSAWTTLASVAAPTARWAPQRETGWAARVADNVIVIAGGLSAPGVYLRDGAVYDGSGTTPKWTPVPQWPSAEWHAFGAGVWTGKELLIWGGRTGATLTGKGERFKP